jgi:8-oxo-dGTP pyrophosphatase MutT (NUDIX family)
MRIRNESQAVIVRKKDDAMEFLLLKRRYPAEAGKIQTRLVKGGIEPGETPEETVKREIKEEVGLAGVKIIRKLGGYEYEVGNIHHKVNSFLVEADKNEVASAVSLDEGEAVIDEVFWVSGEQAIELLAFPEEQNLIRLAIS